MKHFSFKLAAISLIAAFGLTSTEAYAAPIKLTTPPLVKTRMEAKPVRPFRGQKPWGVQTANCNSRTTGNSKRLPAVAQPSKTFSDLSYYDFLEAPDGSTWFYTSEYDIEYDHVSEWYTEENIVGYTFTIYDSSFKEVGTIKDKITLKPGESRVAGCVLDPAVSAHFFNADDNFEVMVYLAMNTSGDYGYEVHYYNKVYSIGGQRDAAGNDISLTTIPGRCVDAFNAATASGSENCFYTFVEDVYPNMDDYGFDQLVDYLNDAKTVVYVYGKAVDGEEPKVVFQKDIFMTRIPGDTTDGIYLITKQQGGTPYFVFSQYEKPYFVDPTGYATDESATPDNSLVIEVYAYNNGMNAVSTTKIPVEINNVEGEINYVFYSIGSVAWKDDIDMTVSGTPQSPAFLVARDYTKASNLEEVASSYDIYGTDGKLLHNLAANTDGIVLLSPIEGQQPQALFVHIAEGDEYIFNFVNLYSGEKVLSMSHIFDGNILTASCERVPANDGYQYVFELQYDEQDEQGNDIKRVAWVNKDGSLARIDRINMGKDVMAAAVNMYPISLSPHLYDTDDAMEYAVLVKRNTGNNTVKNEFLVVDDNGDWYASFTDEDGKGSPMMFTIVPGSDINRLQMVYATDNKSYNADIYDLPFQSGESAIAGVNAANDGPTAYYDLSGRPAATPKRGIYVRKNTGKVQKVVIR